MAVRVICWDPVRPEPRTFVSDFPISSKPMPTAIVRAYTSGGLVIAADGYDGRLNRAQKIFSAENAPDLITGCGLSDMGEALFANNENVETNISFLTECMKTVEEMKTRQFSNFEEYVRAFSHTFKARVMGLIRGGQKEGRILEEDVVAFLSQPNDKAQLHFTGYFANKPFFAITSVPFKMKEEEPKLIELTELGGEDSIPFIVHGSQKVKERIESRDPDFLKFNTPAYTRTVQGKASLSDAVEAARNYIEACFTDKARKLDRACEYIAGRIHIATITPTEGFQWAIPPI